jgi:hypothetical protein
VRLAPILVRALLLGVVAFGCAGPSGPVSAGPPFPPPRDEREAEARAQFLEEHLAAQRLHAEAWQWGWTTVNVGTLGYSILQAARTNDGSERAYNTAQAALAGIGLVDLWIARPVPGREGAAPLAGLDRAARIERGQQLLVERAMRARSRDDWKLHLGNLGLQAFAAGLLLALHHQAYAWLSFATGVAGGEAYIWSEPWQPARDLAAYRRLVETGLPAEPDSSLRLAPTPHGVALELRY